MMAIPLGLALAGILGVFLRWGVGLFVVGTPFPWPTLIVNMLGGFLIGWGASQSWPNQFKLIFSVGFVGTLTTFSTYAWDTVRLFREGQLTLALVNIGANNVATIGLALLGFWLGQKN